MANLKHQCLVCREQVYSDRQTSEELDHLRRLVREQAESLKSVRRELGRCKPFVEEGYVRLRESEVLSLRRISTKHATLVRVADELAGAAHEAIGVLETLAQMPDLEEFVDDEMTDGWRDKLAAFEKVREGTQ